MANRWINYELCKEEALKYKNISEFKSKSGCYKACKRNNWLDDIRALLPSVHKQCGYWTFDKCKEEALKYITKSEFKKSSTSAYSISVKKGYIKDICNHMITCGNRKKRLVYCIKFSDNTIYIGLTYNFNLRCIDHNRKGTVYKHMKKYNLMPEYEILTDYMEIEEAQKIEIETIKSYIDNNYNVLNIKNGGELGGNQIYWTFDKCKEEALKYNINSEFRKNSKSCYVIATKNKWLNEITTHLSKPLQNKRGYWTYEKCKEVSLNYKKRKIFKINCGAAYEASRENGWLDDFFPKN